MAFNVAKHGSIYIYTHNVKISGFTRSSIYIYIYIYIYDISRLRVNELLLLFENVSLNQYMSILLFRV